MKSAICSTTGCENLQTPQTKKCRNCNHSINRWMKRHPAEVRAYSLKLVVRGNRMNYVIEEFPASAKRNIQTSKVIYFPKKQARAG